MIMLLIIIVYHVELTCTWVTEPLTFHCQAGLQVKTYRERGWLFVCCRDSVVFFSPFVLALMEGSYQHRICFCQSPPCSTCSARLLPLPFPQNLFFSCKDIQNHENCIISGLSYSLFLFLFYKLSHLENPNGIFAPPKNMKSRSEKLYILFTNSTNIKPLNF